MRSSTRPNSLLLFLLAFSVTLWVAGFLNGALAQTVDPKPAFTPDIKALFGSVFLLAAGLVAWTRVFRDNVYYLDGKRPVLLFNVASGAVAGAFGQWRGYLVDATYLEFGFPFGGILFGAVAGVMAAGLIGQVNASLSKASAVVTERV